MEPIKHTKTARLGNLMMYREDLDQLVALFQQACTRVTISDSTNRYESLGEMKQHIGSKIKAFDIQGEQPGVHFILNRSELIPGSTTMTVFNELRTEEITKDADNLFFNIKEFLVARQRPRFPKHFAIPAITGLVGLMYVGAHASRGADVSAVTLLELILFSILLVGSILVPGAAGNFLTLDSRLNSPSFWAKYREQFAVSALTQMFNILIGFVLGYLLARLSK
jgi:hypothetical protein